jgi:hypothetical protein
MSMRTPFTRSQKTTIIYGILCIVLLITILQLWLLTATMNAYLGGEAEMAVPAALVSLVCLVLNGGLLRYLFRLDRPVRKGP